MKDLSSPLSKTDINYLLRAKTSNFKRGKMNCWYSRWADGKILIYLTSQLLKKNVKKCHLIQIIFSLDSCDCEILFSSNVSNNFTHQVKPLQKMDQANKCNDFQVLLPRKASLYFRDNLLPYVIYLPLYFIQHYHFNLETVFSNDVKFICSRRK